MWATSACAWHNTAKSGGFHFRCPECGNQYHPWTDRPIYCKANKVPAIQPVHRAGLITDAADVEATGTPVPASTPTALSEVVGGALGTAGAAAPRSPEWRVFPLLWPGSVAQYEMNLMKTVYTEAAMWIRDIPRAHRMDKVVQEIQRYGTPSCMERRQLAPHVLELLHRVNHRGD